ncbi:twin-arginine translocase subunit TatC [Bacillus sp. ISL-18]|uniref:twin-arginine translocase subunit TatC n=1 Tax=Bacillus sp. ISL-18 TaxID=2819118 RepID=UPI001BE57577|nr:twin-arginine translocase subunit TatC [Bacillus sp. ISL-18]MBT2655840.1 twin-arginine translocase subunit TatC [Bacillus sp. ISL-18]
MNDIKHDWLEHTGELRRRLIISAIAFLVFLGLALVYVKEIYYFLMGNLHDKLMVLGPSDIMSIYFHIATIAALAGTILIAAWQIWLFVKPALKSSERKIMLAYIPALFLLFVGGITFGYFFIFPNVLTFLTNIGNNLLVTSFTADKYFSFLIYMTVPFGIAFELPLVSMFLTTIGLMNPYIIERLRKYAYFILVIIAAMISPPEFISNISVAIPLILLYEISVLFSKLVYNRNQKLLAPLDERNPE